MESRKFTKYEIFFRFFLRKKEFDRCESTKKRTSLVARTFRVPDANVVGGAAATERQRVQVMRMSRIAYQETAVGSVDQKTFGGVPTQGSPVPTALRRGRVWFAVKVLMGNDANSIRSLRRVVIYFHRTR